MPICTRKMKVLQPNNYNIHKKIKLLLTLNYSQNDFTTYM